MLLPVIGILSKQTILWHFLQVPIERVLIRIFEMDVVNKLSFTHLLKSYLRFVLLFVYVILFYFFICSWQFSLYLDQ